MDLNQSLLFKLRPTNLIRSATGLFPDSLRFELARRQLNLNLEGSSELTVKIARTKEEMEGAFKILHDEYVRAGFMAPDPSGIRLTPYHALPTTTTVIALWNGEVAGTISAIRDSAFGFPLDKICDTDSLRKNGARLTEISALAINKKFRQNHGAILFPLIKYMIEYSMKFFGSDYLVIAVNPAHIDFYRAILCFQPFGPVIKNYGYANGAPAVCAYISFREFYNHLLQTCRNSPPSKNMFHYLMELKLPNLVFPERKYFKISDPVMTPELLDYFFNQRTKIFESLSPREKAVLNVLYTDKRYASVLPLISEEYEFQLPSRKEERFDVNCQGRIILSKERIVKMKILDVSLRGFCAILDAPIRFGEPVMINIAVGDFVVADVNAFPVRSNKDNVYGFSIKEFDPAWKAFVEHLRCDHVPKAA